MNQKLKKVLLKYRPQLVLSQSEYFDKEWYSERYNINKKNAEKHFLKYGYQQGNNPSSTFDCQLYKKANPDIEDINPLLHWECYGMYESRDIKPSEKSQNLDEFYDIIVAEGAKLYSSPTSIYDHTRLVLAFSHEMNLTGAPIALVNALMEMKQNGFYPVLISLKDGELTEKANGVGIPVAIHENLYQSEVFEHCLEVFDLLFINTFSFFPLISRLNGTNNKVIWWIHECKLFYEQAKEQLQLQFLPQCLEDNISIYAVGEYAKNQLLNIRPDYQVGDFLYFLPDEEKKEEVVNFGFEDENKTIIGVVGTIEKRKGINVLLEALRKLDLREKNKIKVVVVGSKIDNELYDQILSFDDDIEVVYIEKIKRDLMRNFYERINCLVCASTDDPMPVVVTEAWKFGVPVICSEFIGSAKFAEKYGGAIVYKNNDPSNLAQAITDFVAESNHETLVREGQKIYNNYFTEEVFKNKLTRIINSVLNKKSEMSYRKFMELSSPSKEELEQQRNEEIKESDVKFSVLVPLYNTPLNFLDEMIESVINQTYGKWELCLADGSDKAYSKEVYKEVKKYQDKDARIQYKRLERNGGISENLNEALKMAKGDFVVLFDHDDLLAKNALHEFAKVIREDKEVDCIYSDEDKVDETSDNFFEPNFKPDFNIDLLCSTNYICHLFAVRRTLIDKYGGFRSKYDGAQDHEFILRMTNYSRKISHVAKILYHWRVHSNSTAQDPKNKMYCFEAGQKAIKAYYNHKWPKLKIDAIENGAYLGAYHIKWNFKEYPLISVLIPNKDHINDLDKAIKSMIKKGTWPNLEFIIIENNSEEAETFEYYKMIQKKLKNVKVVYYDGSFNYSRINNFGAKYASGEYYLLLNNDVELIASDSIKEMMGFCQRDDVGIVGCRLLYDDNTIQHGGVIVGIAGIAGHAFKGLRSSQSYFNRALLVQDYSAVTAAVLLTKKSVFDAVGGLDEKFEVAFNDIDFCLRVRQINKLVVYNPYACFYHYESKSRGLEDTSEKQSRFNHEIAMFNDRYAEVLEKGDEFYNPNLTLISEDFSLKDLNKEEIGKQFYSKEQKEFLKTFL